MKKLIFTLLTLLCAGTLSAQSLTAASAYESATNFLREEGYAPHSDEDGDITFKLQGNNYCIHVEGQSDGSLFVNCYTGFQSEQPFQKILEGCNQSNRVKSVVKYYALQDENGAASYMIGYERFHNPTDDFLQSLKDAISLLPSCVAQFISEYE